MCEWDSDGQIGRNEMEVQEREEDGDTQTHEGASESVNEKEKQTERDKIKTLIFYFFFHKVLSQFQELVYITTGVLPSIHSYPHWPNPAWVGREANITW